MFMYCAELRGNYRACNCLQVKFTFVWKPSIYAAESAKSWKVNTTTFPDQFYSTLQIWENAAEIPRNIPQRNSTILENFLWISEEWMTRTCSREISKKFFKLRLSSLFLPGIFNNHFFSFYRGGGVLQSWVKKSCTFII